MKKRVLFLIGMTTLTLAACNVDTVNASISKAKTKEKIEPTPEIVHKMTERGNLKSKISEKEEVSNYIKNLSYDKATVLSHDMTTKVEPSGTSATGGEAELVVTTKTEKSVKSGSGDIETMQASDSLFPGQVILADDNLNSGHPTTINLARGKGKAYVSVPGLVDTGFTVDVVDQGTIQGGITKKLNEWITTSTASMTVDAQMDITQVYNSSQLDVDLGIGISKKLDISAEYVTSKETNTFVVSYEQIFYNVNMSMEDKDTTVFADSVTKSELQEKIEKDGKVATPPLMISQASYGKLVYFKVESSMSEDEVSAAFKYAGSINAEIQAKFNETMKSSKISALVYGGSSSGYSSLTKIKSDQAASEISKLLSKDYQVRENIVNGKLLCYGLNFLDHNQEFAEVVSSSRYTETTYKTLKQQKVYVREEGCFVVKAFWIHGRPIEKWTVDGKPVFGNLKELYYCSNFTAGEEITYYAPANYGQIEFRYDIAWGSKPAFAGRVSSNDFFEKCDIRTCGSSCDSYIKLNVDGLWQQI